MPGDYYFEEGSRVLVSLYWGRVSLADIMETIERRTHDPDMPDAKASVILLADAEWVEVPADFVRKSVERLRLALGPPTVRTVFVTPEDFWFGFTRMYAIVHELYGWSKIDVVRTWGEAASILGMDLSAAENWVRQRSAAGEGTHVFGGG